MRKRTENDILQDTEYFKNVKYYCSKCKFYKDGCSLKRVVRVCKKEGLRNVPISKNY